MVDEVDETCYGIRIDTHRDRVQSAQEICITATAQKLLVIPQLGLVLVYNVYTTCLFDTSRNSKGNHQIVQPIHWLQMLADYIASASDHGLCIQCILRMTLLAGLINNISRRV